MKSSVASSSSLLGMLAGMGSYGTRESQEVGAVRALLSGVASCPHFLVPESLACAKNHDCKGLITQKILLIGRQGGRERAGEGGTEKEKQREREREREIEKERQR